jgi:hypothetical protein
LLDLAGDLLALGPEDHTPQLGNDQLEMFDLVAVAEQTLLLCSKSFVLG